MRRKMPFHASYRFRWAFRQLEVLRQCFPSSMRGIRSELPGSLEATYERILHQIPKVEPNACSPVTAIPGCGRLLLYVEESAEVLAIDFSPKGGTPIVDELH